MSLEMKESSSVKMFGPPTLEACAMASIHFNNIGTGDFLNPILQKEVDAFRMLVGEFKVISIEVEVRRADGKELSKEMEQFGRAHFDKTFPLKLAEMVAVEKREDYWEVRNGGVIDVYLYLSFCHFVFLSCLIVFVFKVRSPNHSDQVT